jgi:hypothetical protein
MSINKVFITGCIKGKPYEVPGRNRSILRFKLSLPSDPQRRGNVVESALIEATGRNAEYIFNNVGDGDHMSLEGRLRTTLLSEGDRRIEALLVRLEKFALITPIPDQPTESQPTKRRRRRRSQPDGDHPPRTEQREPSPGADAPAASNADAPAASNADAPAASNADAPAPQGATAAEASSTTTEPAAASPAGEASTSQDLAAAPTTSPVKQERLLELPKIDISERSETSKDMPF